MSDDLLTYEDVQQRFGVSRRTVNRMVSDKRLRCVWLGWRTVRFSPADVERAIAKMKGETR